MRLLNYFEKYCRCCQGSCQSESWPSYKQSSWCLTGRTRHQCVCAVIRIDVKLGVPSASVHWWTLKFPRHPSRTEGSYRWYHEQIKNSCPNQQMALHRGTAATSANDATLEPCAPYKWRRTTYSSPKANSEGIIQFSVTTYVYNCFISVTWGC